MKKTNFDKYLEEQLKDPEFAAGFEEAGSQWDLALQIARRREAAGLTQAGLATRVGTTQQQISRLERPNYRGSLTTLQRVAAALGVVLEIRLRPLAPKKSAVRSAKIPKGAVATKTHANGKQPARASAESSRLSQAKLKTTRV